MPQKRSSGVLLHITSLPGLYGCGGLGPEALAFAEMLSARGFSHWQLLPLTPTEEISGNSPYSAPSAFAGNLLLISPEALFEEGLVSKEELARWEVPSLRAASFKHKTECVNALLPAAWKRVKDNPADFAPLSAAFEGFQKEEGWLSAYSLFVLLKERYGGPWTEWPKEFAEADKKALNKFEKENEESLALIKFTQFISFRQLEALRLRCQELGISLIGDLPIYIAWDSADLWNERELFDLRADGTPGSVAGVPPDYFSATGQRLGNPLYNWDAMRKDNFAWWRKRISCWLRFCGLLRIDHFRGLCGCWAIPAEEKTAVNGCWRPVPGDELLSAFSEGLSGYGPLPLIAEDLGIITDDVRALMKKYALPGMKVLLFAFGGADGSNPYLPHNITTASVVYTGTHDNDTVKGWWEKSSTEEERLVLCDYTGFAVTEENVASLMTRLALASKASLAIIPAQDLLSLGADCRMNIPSEPLGNWEWRLLPQEAEKLSSMENGFIGSLKRLNRLYGRNPRQS